MQENKNYETLEKLAELRKFQEMKLILESMPTADIAEFIEECSITEAIAIFRSLKKDISVEVFSYFSAEMQESIISKISDKEISNIIEELYVDDAVDMLEEMPAFIVKKVLKNASASTRSTINRFLNYPQDSVGSIMTAEFTDLYDEMTVADALSRIRCVGEDRETVYTCYVICKTTRVLEGVISVKDLLRAKDSDLISDMMETNVIKVSTTEEKQNVINLFSKYDLISLPVTDNENRLVGIVTIDDVMDVIEEETTKDIEQMAAIIPSDSDTPYLKTAAFTMAKSRIVWLSLLMLAGMITGGILSEYEQAVSALPILVTFIPMLTGTGGNSGSQSSTMIIRGMTLGEINTKDIFKVLWKETCVALLCGGALSLLNFIKVILFNPGEYMIALTITLAVFFTVILAKATGAVLPIVAKLLRLDPAVMAAPLITTIVDASSLIIFFNIANMLLASRLTV